MAGRIVMAAVSAIALVGCGMGSETPAPGVAGEIVAMEFEGAVGEATINGARRTVEVVLGEAVDLREVKIAAIEVTEGGVCGLAAGDVLDLTQPLTVTVKTTSAYEWTVSAVQDVEYRFGVEGQIGETLFEMHTRSVFAFVPGGTDLTAVTILDLKLAPEGVQAIYNPSLESLMSEPQPFITTEQGGEAVCEIEVSYRDVTEKWYLHVTQSNVMVERVNPFARKAYLSAFGSEDQVHGFEYRSAAGFDPAAAEEDQGWIRIAGEQITEGENGAFSATLTDLSPDTEYFVRAFSGEDRCEYREFMTVEERELPGASFEEWSWGVDDKKSEDGSLKNVEAWAPWAEGAQWEVNRWWDTGNRGVAFVDRDGGGNSLRDENGYRGNGAVLETRWAVVKVAGGNIYFGEFGEMYGMNATCRLGHNWTTKPTGLKGFYKYFPQPVNRVSEEHRKLHPYRFSTEKWMNSPDSLHVCVALWASPDGRDIPFQVNTVTDNGGAEFVDFSRDADGVIAYGAFVSPDEQAAWSEFNIEMDYLDQSEMSRTTVNYLKRNNYFSTGVLPPNTQLYLLITASKNCNYFIAGTGGGGTAGSTMHVDELEMIYE
jgi:hypothetical protein